MLEDAAEDLSPPDSYTSEAAASRNMLKNFDMLTAVRKSLGMVIL